MTFSTARMESKMVIRVGKEIRTKEMLSYSKGKDTSYSEFLSPPRDKGVKYLKIKDNMWMYLPDVDKIIKIAGHMLRQSMMGSDFSYEDALDSAELLDKYTATLLSNEVISSVYKSEGVEVETKRPCYVVDLTAKVKEVTYYRRLVWIDSEMFVPLREELFAKSGKKLKVMTLGDVKKHGSRHYPMYMTMQNLMRSDSLTEMFVTRAQFNIPVPASTFTQGNLTK